MLAEVVGCRHYLTSVLWVERAGNCAEEMSVPEAVEREEALGKSCWVYPAVLAVIRGPAEAGSGSVFPDREQP